MASLLVLLVVPQWRRPLKFTGLVGFCARPLDQAFDRWVGALEQRGYSGTRPFGRDSRAGTRALGRRAGYRAARLRYRPSSDDREKSPTFAFQQRRHRSEREQRAARRSRDMG